MSQIESMLLNWRSLYAEWVVAELELRTARHRRPGSRGVAILEARVRRLQQECQAALDHTSAALATGHEAPAGGYEAVADVAERHATAA